MFFSALDDRARRTFFWDTLNAFCRGMLDTGPTTFFLFIAIRRFGASELFKSLVSIPIHVGMLASLWLLGYLAASRWPKSRISATLRAMTGICFLIASWHDGLYYYAFWVLLGGMLGPFTLSLQTSIYQENYPHHLRGKLFGWSATVNVVASGLFHWIVGSILEYDIGYYRVVLGSFGFMGLLSAWAIWQIPSLPPTRRTERSVWSAFQWLWKDKLFGYMILVWYVFGFSNLMIIPLRVLYVSEERYGLDLSPTLVALVVGIIPDAGKLIFTPVWAFFFDRYNFITIRLVMNIVLTLSIFTYFATDHLGWILFASVLHGIFFAGGNIAWNLWVTHFAPPERTAEYMAVHVFFTGTRGIIGVFLGVHLTAYLDIREISWIASGICLLSVFMLIPVRPMGKNLQARHRASV